MPEVLGQGMKGNLSRLRSHELPVRSIGCVWPIPATKIRASFKRGHLVQDSKKEKRVKVRRTEMQDPVLSPLYPTQVPLSSLGLDKNAENGSSLAYCLPPPPAAWVPIVNT